MIRTTLFREIELKIKFAKKNQFKWSEVHRYRPGMIINFNGELFRLRARTERKLYCSRLFNGKEMFYTFRKDRWESRRQEWDEDEVFFLIKNLNKGYGWIARELGRTKKSVEREANYLHLARIWSPDQIRLLKKWRKQGLTQREIAQNFGKSTATVKMKCYKLRIKQRDIGKLHGQAKEKPGLSMPG